MDNIISVVLTDGTVVNTYPRPLDGTLVARAFTELSQQIAMLEAARATSPAPIGDSGASDDATQADLWRYVKQLAASQGYSTVEAAIRAAPNSRALVSANSASDALPARNVGLTDWRHRCAVLIDIYDDGTKNAPEDRSYVEGAFTAEIDEVRALLAAPEALPEAAPVSLPVDLAQVADELRELRVRNAALQAALEIEMDHSAKLRAEAAPASEPIARDVLTDEQCEALQEAICWADNEGLPGTVDTLRSILEAAREGKS